MATQEEIYSTKLALEDALDAGDVGPDPPPGAFEQVKLGLRHLAEALGMSAMLESP